MTDLSLLDLILMANLFLSRSYTSSSQILFLFGFLVCCTELKHERILISSLYLFRSPVGVYRTHNYPTEFTLIRRYPKVEITERVQVLRNLFLNGSTCKYYGTYTDLTEHILVLQNLDMYFRSYTCLTEHILILRILYWSYRIYTCLTDLILVLRNLYLSYGSYSCAKVSVGTISRN